MDRFDDQLLSALGELRRLRDRLDATHAGIVAGSPGGVPVAQELVDERLLGGQLGQMGQMGERVEEEAEERPFALGRR